MSDRIAIMRSGGIEQIGTARELYQRPANSFVASFLGESNLLAGKVSRLENGEAELTVPALAIPLLGKAASGLTLGSEAAALLRPESLRVAAVGNGGLAAQVEETVYLGDTLSIRLRLANGAELWCRRFAGEGEPPAGPAALGWSKDEVRILPLSPPLTPAPSNENRNQGE